MAMDEIDIWSIQSLIEAKTGSKGEPYIPDKDLNLFLEFVVQTVPTLPMPREHKFAVFSVDRGVPDLFTLTGYSQPVVCYHHGYVGKFIKFRNYIMLDPQEPSIDLLGMGDLFDLLSALYLQSGNSKFALLCLFQSIIQTPSLTTDKESYDAAIYQLNTAFHHRHSIEEATFTLLYFGLTHEIGHSYGDDALRAGAKVHSQDITDKAIRHATIQAARRAFKDRPDRDFVFGEWSDYYQEASKEKGSVLHFDNLRSEILADNLGFNMLNTALSSIARYKNQRPNFKIIASEVVISLFVVQLMEACKYLTKALPSEDPKRTFKSRAFPIEINDTRLSAHLYAAQLISDFQVAHAVRWEFLKPSLTSLALMHLFPDTYAVKGGKLTITCSASELERRQGIAENNVEGYLSYYTKEMMKFQSRLEDVVNFVAHMATGKVSEVKNRQATDKTFVDQISNNFQIYLSRLTDHKGVQRKKEIVGQLNEFRKILAQKGKESDTKQIDRIVSELESDLRHHKK